MQVEKLEKSADSILISIKGIDEGLLHAFKERLGKDKSVTLANYFKNHPFLNDPELLVKISSGKPQSALKRTAKAMANDYAKMKKLFLKACAKYESGD